MTLYNVHIYREMRLFFPGIEAETSEDAARTTAQKPTHEADYTEDCDGENLAALVDVVGNDDYSQSVTIDFEAQRLRKAAHELLEVLKTLAEQADEDCPAACRTRHFAEALEAAYAAIAKATIHQPTIERTLP